MLNPEQKQELKGVLKIKQAAVSAHNSAVMSRLQEKEKKEKWMFPRFCLTLSF